MTLAEELDALERGFWDASSRADGDYYRANCTDDVLFVFFFGTLDLVTCAEVVDGNRTPWKEYRFENVRVLELADGAVAYSYRATARHQGAMEDVVIYVTSIYVQRDGAWKMALHQQTQSQPWGSA